MQNEGMDYLNSRLMFGMVPGLSSTRKLCDALGNPEKKFRSIHVVGTNGKGSTSFYLSGILQAHGYKTALYTSPHLVNLCERIRVNDIPIDEACLNRLLLQVKFAAEQVHVEPTFFEVLTIVAFLYYAEQNVAVAVLEAGMGGRLDSTAVAGGGIAVVTSIGLEHTEVLGSTESAILKEKMGVVGTSREISEGKTFVLGGLSKQLLEEGRECAAACGCKCVVPKIRENIVLPNLGRHYIENASLSLNAAAIFIGTSFDEVLSLNVLKTRSWAGRMQILSNAYGEACIILDGAHNSHAVCRLVQTLHQYYPGKKFQCLFGALKDKDVGEMLKMMSPFVSKWHITKTSYPRFRELSDLRQELSKLNIVVASEGELSREYMNKVVAENASSTEKCPLLITGSLYMIGASIQLLKDEYDGLKFFRGLEPTTNEHR